MGKITRFFIASETNNYSPGVLSYKAFILYGVVLMLLRVFMGPTPAMSAAVDSGKLMALINMERVNRNLNALYTNDKLLLAAAEKARDMIDRDYFSHIDPDGNYIWAKVTAAGYTPYQILGENLAINFDTSEGMIEAWLNSPKHRENLLHLEFIDQGLVAAYGDYQGHYTNLTASLFGTLASVKNDASVKNATINGQQTNPRPSTPAPVKIEEQGDPVAEEIEAAPETPRDDTPAPTAPHRPSPRIPNLTRIVFTAAGLLLLGVLTIDAIIIHKHDLALGRSHSSHHLLSFFLLVIVSIVIWWW